MTDLITETIAAGGYFGIFMLMVIENVFPPIPSEVIMGLGGVLLARGQMEYAPLLIAGTLGTTAGNYMWFWIGRHFGYERLRPFVDRHGRWLTLDYQHVESAAGFFRRHGQWVVFAMRFSPFLRTIISLPAGLARMGAAKFLAFTAAGATIWNVLLIEGGRFIEPFMAKYDTVAAWLLGGFVAAILGLYLYRVITWKPRAEP